MALLHDAFGLESNGNRYRHKLKECLINDYRNKIMFVKSHYHHPEIVIGADSVNSNLLLNNKDVIIKEAAQLLQSDIIEYLNNLPEIPWPLHIDSFDKAEHFPDSIIQFLEYLVKSPGRKTTENVKRIVNSFASDFIESISGKKITTAKHLVLALGLHNKTGQKKVLQILNKLGHCISYDLTREIETSQAQVSLIEQENNSILPILPTADDDIIRTYFWVDNFDKIIKSMTGGEAVNSTHMIAFQEISNSSLLNKNKVTFKRNRLRKLPPQQECKKFTCKY